MSTILFADDHHAFRTVFAEALRTAGHTVLEAGTPAEAERALERHSRAVDLLLVEAVLTTGNGLGVLRRIQPLHPDIRVLFISDRSADDLTKAGLLLPAAHFARKPFHADRLMAALRELLGGGETDSKETRSRARPTRSSTRSSGTGG